MIIFAEQTLNKHLSLKNKCSDNYLFNCVSYNLARILITSIAKVNTPKKQKNAPAAESGNKRRKRTKDKLIRLDDLIPEQDVKGGHHLLFGVTDTTPTKNNPN